MSINDQIRVLMRIKMDLEKEVIRLPESPLRVEIQDQIEAIEWAVQTLGKTHQMIEAQSWLVGVIK